MIFGAIYFACVAAFCVWCARPGPARLRKWGEEFARRNKAFVDSEFVPAFDRATVRSSRFKAAAAAVLLSLFWVFMQAQPESHNVTPDLVVLPVGAGLLACWAGWRVHGAGREFPVPEGRAAVARVRRVTPDDYLARWARYGAWAGVVVSCGLAVGAAVQWNQGDARPLFAVLAGVNSVALLVATLVAQLSFRAMCERPQPAVDPCQLYFYDAWRTEYVRQAYLVIWWSQFQFFVSVVPWLDWPPAVDDHIFSIMMVFFIAQVGVLLLSSHLRFRKRLWPTLANGQVLLPGQAVPARAGVLA